jgi:hypothetical protein
MYTMVKLYKGIPHAHVIMQEALEETLRGLQVKVVASDIVVYKSEPMIFIFGNLLMRNIVIFTETTQFELHNRSLTGLRHV